MVTVKAERVLQLALAGLDHERRVIEGMIADLDTPPGWNGKTRKMTVESRRKISAGMKRRWKLLKKAAVKK